MAITVVILAAGQGKRMRSSLAKVLHPLAGRPMLAHVLESAATLKPREVRVVHGHGGDAVKAAFAGQPLVWVEQAEQRGTGHAVRLALPKVPAKDVVLVLYGDVPLVQPATLRKLVRQAAAGHLAVLTAELDDPTGYGRIVRGASRAGGAGGEVLAIVEDKDATASQRAIREINTGLLAVSAGKLAGWVAKLRAANAQKEYYLTDVIALAGRGGVRVVPVVADNAEEVLGINDKAQLAAAEAVLRRRLAGELLAAGVTLADPARIDVRGRLRCGRDVSIDVNAVFEGEVTLGDGVSIGPNAVIRDSVIAAGTRIHPQCVIEQAEIGERCEIGPFARLRPGVVMAEGGKIGNFVEVKKSRIGRGSKVNHLTYVGDSTIGAKTNVGAGTITCNYDGANKHQTVIGDEVFIGSGVELVAPVRIGDGATVGAGSTVTKDVPPGQLCVARARQALIPGWKRPQKKK